MNSTVIADEWRAARGAHFLVRHAIERSVPAVPVVVRIGKRSLPASDGILCGFSSIPDV